MRSSNMIMTTARFVAVMMIPAVFFLVRPVFAWETLVQEGKNGEFNWQSIYQQVPVNKAAQQLKRQIKPPEEFAEHSRLSDMALKKLGVLDLFGRKGTAFIDVTDLNASYFRFDDMDGLPSFGDDSGTILEERRIPAPALFAGMPDYSYNVYDWLNKNELCPPGHKDKIGDKCHAYFLGWLGNLNSTHFGSQATKMYAHYHRIALHLATRARELHQQIRDAGEAEKEAYVEAYVKEAELEALAYEGYAQHYLQDRWSIGHMWERWGAGDYDQLPCKSNGVNTSVGALAGLIHGAEAVFGNEEHNITEKLYPFIPEWTFNLPKAKILSLPEWLREIVVSGHFAKDRNKPIKLRLGDYFNAADPMTSPLIFEDHIEPMLWQHTSILPKNRSLLHGVGDDRLTDMQDGMFGKEYLPLYQDFPLRDSVQKHEMLGCSMAGWAQVIRKLGEFDGAYGVFKAKLAMNSPDYDVLEKSVCWDMWVTNESLYTGLTGGSRFSSSVMGRLAYKAAKNIAEITFPRNDLIRLNYRLEQGDQKNPNGTDMAQGQLGPALCNQTGDNYQIPGFAEPEKLEFSDFAVTETGRDRASVYGAFSKAHSDYWCVMASDEIFHKLRGIEDKRKQTVCQYLADLSYEGTDKDYDGSQKERRKHDGQEIKSICSLRNKTHPDAPTHIDQGYVPYGDAGMPEDRAENGYSTQSIANWCAKTPLFTLASEPTLKNENVVKEISVDEEEIVLEGENLGPNAGSVVINIPEAGWKELGSIRSWSDNRIEIRIDVELKPEKKYELSVTTAKKKESVGLFRLKTSELEIVERDIRLVDVGPCHIPLNIEQLPTVEFTKSVQSWEKLTVPLMEALREAATPFWQQAAALMEREANCIDQRRLENVIPHYDPERHAAIIPEESRYPPIIVQGKPRNWYLGDEMLWHEKEKFTAAWGSADAYLYRWHSKVLHAMATEFLAQVSRLEQELDHARELAEVSRYTNRDEDRQAVLHYRQTTYERLLEDYEAAPAYMAYLGTGLNRWAVAEDHLIRKVMPTLENMRVQRLQLAETRDQKNCASAWSGFDLNLHNAPVDLLVSTPQFGLMRYSPSRTDMVHSYGQLYFINADRPAMQWVTPQRLVDVLEWQPDYRVLSSLPASECAYQTEAFKKIAAMASFGFIYGDQMAKIMGMGQLYESLYRKQEGNWLPEDEEVYTCLRCQRIEAAIADTSLTLKGLKITGLDKLTAWGGANIYTRSNTAIPHLEKRIKTLEQQLSQCREKCQPTEMQDSVQKMDASLREKYVLEKLRELQNSSAPPVAAAVIKPLEIPEIKLPAPLRSIERHPKPAQVRQDIHADADSWKLGGKSLEGSGNNGQSIQKRPLATREPPENTVKCNPEELEFIPKSCSLEKMTFADLRKESRKRIKEAASKLQTDYNRHDPGINFSDFFDLILTSRSTLQANLLGLFCHPRPSRQNLALAETPSVLQATIIKEACNP